MTYSLLVLVAALGSIRGGTPPGDRGELLRSIAGAYEENRAKFPHGIVRYETLDGFADSTSKAREGSLREVATAPCEYTFDGKHALGSRLFPAEDMAGTTTVVGNRSWSRLNSFRAVTNGALTLLEQVSSVPGPQRTCRGAVIVAGDSTCYRSIELFPLDLGFSEGARHDLGGFLRMVLDKAEGTAIEAIDMDARLDDIRVAKLTLKGRNGTGTYWLDLERGAIPLYWRDDVGGALTECFLDDVRAVPGHGWLPFRATVCMSGGRVKHVALRDVDFDRKPARTAFRLGFPEPIPMANMASGRAYKPRRVWDLDDLPAANSAAAQPIALPSPGAFQPDLPGEREAPGPPYSTYAAVAASILIVATALIYRRSRTR